MPVQRRAGQRQTKRRGTASRRLPAGAYLPLNPYNDVVYQEPPLGSGNGIKALELEGVRHAWECSGQPDRAQRLCPFLEGSGHIWHPATTRLG